MIDNRNIAVILMFVLVFGIAIQVVRSDYIFSLSKNSNLVSNVEYDKGKNSLSNDAVNKLHKERFMIIYDSNEPNSVKIKENVARVLGYMKKEKDVFDIRNFNGIKRDYKTIILTFQELNGFSSLDSVLQYVSNGGKLIFAQMPNNDDAFLRIYRKLGIYEADRWVDLNSLKMKSNVLIQSKNVTMRGNFIINSSLAVGLDKKCKIYITDAETGNDIPLLWDVACGKGKIMVFNGTMLTEKINRGIITGMISLLNPNFIYPVFNMKIAYIDDFPAPIPHGYNKDIYKQYGRSIPKFYREVWWPDIMGSAAKYDIKYTGMIIETYNNRVKPSFTDGSGYETEDLVVYGRELLKSGGELGIHGYNHQSLAEKGFIKQDLGYNSWACEQDVIAALNEVKRYVKSVYPYYKFRCYVPPSNILSSMGKEAILKALPEITIISSVYYDSDFMTSYTQEFEVGKDGIIEMPRLTYGYEKNSEINWNILNGATSLGIFSHFIHPDDILDRERNGSKTWDELSKEYNSTLRMLKLRYPWLRSMTASEGGEELKKNLDTQVYVENEKSNKNLLKVYLNNFVDDMYFIFRTKGAIKSVQGCKVLSIDSGVYLIQAKKPFFRIELGR